jgi:hypothetical protein
VIALAIIANAVAGSVWRRILGGYLGLRRSYIVAAGCLLAWPLWLALPWPYAMAGTAALMVYWTMGHHVESRWTWLRYLGLPAVGYMLIMPRWRAEWVWRGPHAGAWFIDGGMAVGELWAGAVVWCAVAAVLLM